MELLEIQRGCLCGNRDSKQFWIYGDSKEEVCGAFCETCGKEWLDEKFFETLMTEEIFITIETKRFYFRQYKKASPTTRIVCQSRRVQQGDHLRWVEVQGKEKLTFDAIVESVDDDRKLASVISLQKLAFCEITIGRMLIDLSMVTNLQIVDYGSLCDPAALVVARALASCQVETKVYNILTCKSKVLAGYCKCGPGHGWRAMWLVGTEVSEVLKTLLGSSWVTGREEDCIRVVEQGYAKTKIKSGILFAMDGSAVAFELEDAIAERQGCTDRGSYLDAFIKRFIDILVEKGFKISGAVASGTPGGGIGCFEVPTLEVKMSFFMGSVIKGEVIRAPQKAVGSQLGRVFGQVIHMSVKRGDEEVQLSEINEGDQVVLPGHLSHPRCHAIVVTVNTKTNKLKLIRNMYSRGVVEEWVEVSPPILRVSYGGAPMLPPEEVLQRARSKLGENRYNILTYNCKHFASWCKRR
ncbi:hypothetical protein BSL78_26808 [Apostichopus japonicus]|uniref:LRAT domain-containing protein n=1 Tax=Stichopus japonicus TaxID=307972 RepID=A0A2G8JKT8_STIJA|nr:hypothetical protein BSL78_26808 [Apostichopus japonicus]